MSSEKTKARDSREEVLKLIEHTEALKTLYQGLGYSPQVDRQAQRIVAELASLLRAEIPNLAAFQRALAETCEQIGQHRRGKAAVDPLWMADQELFGAVFEARDDPEEVIELLNEDPLWKTMPYEIEFSVLRKRPVDPDRFTRLLDELETLFKMPWAPQGQEARQAVLDAIAGVRRDLREDGHLLFSLETLACRVDSAAASLSYDEAAQEKKRQLDELLWNLVHFQNAYRPGHPLLQAIVQEQVQRYLDAAWMHTPWLTVYLLTRLLDAELAMRASTARRDECLVGGAAAATGLMYVLNLKLLLWIFAAYLVWCLLRFFQGLQRTRMLQLTRGEVASGHFDEEEITRRLQRQEAKGLYISSLIYALLRLGASSGLEPSARP